MNRLRILNNLSLRASSQGLNPTFEVMNHRINDVSNIKIRSTRELGEFPEFASSLHGNYEIRSNAVIPPKSVTNGATTFVTLRSNKINPFVAWKMGKQYGGFFSQQNYKLAPFPPERSFNRVGARHYSDDSANKIAYSSHVRLDGVWKALSESAPVEFSQDALVWLHSTTGLPWWATVVVATCTVRATITLPLAIYANIVMAKYYNLKHELDEIVKDLKLETNYAVNTFKWTEDYARAMYNSSFMKERKKLMERDNCHPAKSHVVVLIQIPMWISISASLRNMCYMLPYPTEYANSIFVQLATGGFGWITNLALPDSTYIIPVALGLLNLTIIEIQCMLRSTEPTKVQKFMRNFFRLVSIGMIPIAAQVPVAMSLYWATSSAFGVGQNLLLISPRFRRLVRIPETEVELQNPYRHIYQNLRIKIGMKVDLSQGEVKKV